MMTGDEFIGRANYSLVRNSRLVLKSKYGSSITNLMPILYDMAKIVMKIQCNTDRISTDDKLLEDLSKMESAIMKMTLSIEYLKRKGH